MEEKLKLIEEMKEKRKMTTETNLIGKIQEIARDLKGKLRYYDCLLNCVVVNEKSPKNNLDFLKKVNSELSKLFLNSSLDNFSKKILKEKYPEIYSSFMEERKEAFELYNLSWNVYSQKLGGFSK